MGKADKLSRKPDQKVSIEKNNENQKLIKKEQIHSLAEVVIKQPEVDILERIKIAKGKDKVVKVVEEMKKAEVKVLREDKWQIEGDLVLKEEKVYVLKDEELRVEIIWLDHDVLVAGHRGGWKTMKLVIRNYQWFQVTRVVGKYVNSCDMCQKMKNQIEILVGKPKLSEVLEKP